MKSNRRFNSLWLISAIAVLSMLLSLVSGIGHVQAAKEYVPHNVMPTFGALPLFFVPNRGQTDPTVRMQANGLGGALTFAATSVDLTLPSKEATLATHLQLTWEGANPHAMISGRDRLPGLYNIYVGQPKNWHSNLPTYASLHYQNLYPGIDLRYDGQDGALKGAYIVAPGANPALIRWHYQGAKSISLDAATGDLNIQLANGNRLTEHAPIAWQEMADKRSPVQAKFFVQDQTIYFALGQYDRQLPLIIDPTLDTSTFLGGNSTDSGNAIAVDADGNVVVTGQTYSSNFPGAMGARNGSTDFFVSKLNAQGSALLYTTIIGGSDDEESRGLAVDKQGNIWVTGVTQSADFPATALQNTYGGNDDTFVVKLSSTGALLHSGYLGETAYDIGYAIAVDSQGNAYVAGESAATYGPESFVKKIKADMSGVVYNAFFGSAKRGFNKGTSPRAIAVDGEGNTYITGRTNAVFSKENDGGYQPFCTEFDGTDCTFDDAFMLKLNAAGDGIPYYTYLGGKDSDIGTGVALDGNGNILVTGYTFATNFPTKNALQANKRGAENFTDAFVTKFNPQGSELIYSTYLGGEFWEEAHALTVDKDGNA